MFDFRGPEWPLFPHVEIYDCEWPPFVLWKGKSPFPCICARASISTKKIKGNRCHSNVLLSSVKFGSFKAYPNRGW